PVDHLAVTEREDLHDGAIAFDRETDHVDRADRATIGVLPFGEVLDRPKPVAVPRCVLETFLRRCFAHPRLELALDRLRLAGEELDHLVDDGAVVVFGDVTDTRGETP